MMGQVIFVVARESVEALLVIGILWAWLSGRADARAGRTWLLGGIAAGLGLAVALALALMGMTTFLGGAARNGFEIALLTLAAVLIVQMVVWMRRHGRTLKREMENELDRSTARASWWGVFALAAIAIGREGSETVVFLYGSLLNVRGFQGWIEFIGSAALGLVIALSLFWVMQMGARVLSWRRFFQVTEWMLLFLGSSMFLTAMGKLLSGPLAQVDLPVWVYSTVWNTSAMLSDTSGFGSLLAALLAYRAQPIGWDLAALALYWVAVVLVLRLTGSSRPAPTAQRTSGPSPLQAVSKTAP